MQRSTFQIAVLNEQARNVPSWASSENANDLTPTQFEAFKACAAAEAPIDLALLALIPLHGNSPDNQFTAESPRRIVVDVPAVEYEKAWLWVRALAGRRALG